MLKTFVLQCLRGVSHSKGNSSVFWFGFSCGLFVCLFIFQFLVLLAENFQSWQKVFEPALAETSWESLMASVGLSSKVNRGNINYFLFKHQKYILCSAVQNPKYRHCLYWKTCMSKQDVHRPDRSQWGTKGFILIYVKLLCVNCQAF